MELTATREDIVTEALEILGVLGEGEEPNMSMLFSCGRTLDYLVKAWQTEGIHLWAVDTLEIELEPDQTKYEIGPSLDVDVPWKPIRILNGVYTGKDSTDIPVNLWSREEYWRISDKNSPGPALNVYFDRRREKGIIYIWQVPNSTGNKLTLQVQRGLSPFESDEDDADFPSEFFYALSYNLAFALAPKYGTSGARLETIAMQAQMSKEEAYAYGREETSVYLEPDQYSYQW